MQGTVTYTRVTNGNPDGAALTRCKTVQQSAELDRTLPSCVEDLGEAAEAQRSQRGEGGDAKSRKNLSLSVVGASAAFPNTITM
jgi:hypothetical protein